MKNKINVSIVGLGNVGSEYLKFFRNQKNIKNIFINDKFKNLSLIKKFKKYKRIKIENNKKNLISNSDLVTISNYDKDHEKYIIDSIRLNKNIFVEKPMCTSFSQLANIYKELLKKKYKKFLMSNFVLRESEILKKIYKQVKKGEFGKIYYFEGDYLYGRLNKLLNGWRGKDKKYSVMLGGGIHMIDLMVLFLGDFPIEVIVGPEYISGSSRMKAGTAQKMILNMISSTVMIKLGRILDNKMIDMKLSNNKLYDRAIRIVETILSIDKDSAKDLIYKYKNIRLAIKNYKSNDK